LIHPRQRVYYIIVRTLPLLLLAATTFAADLPNGGAIDTIAQKEGRGYRHEFDIRRDAKPHRVLLVGDSILNGHQKQTRELLAEKANVDVWIYPHSVAPDKVCDVFKGQIENQKPYRPYDIVFLHQCIVDWKDPRVTPDTIGPMMKEYVKSIRARLPKARLIWASATPFTEQDLPRELNAKINPIIIERNRIVAKVMEEMDVEVIDLYGLLVEKTHLAYGNMTHWKAPAYDLISQKVAETILKEKSGN